MRLLAISDLHLGNPQNRDALGELGDHRDDWLIVAGDVGEGPEHLELAWRLLAPRFARLLWVPGNHDLWTLPRGPSRTRGAARYRELVEACRAHGVLTPEDPYPTWDGPGGPAVIVPLFLLYDYSFRPDEVPLERVLDWSLEHDVLCADEAFLHPDPHPSRAAWCAARLALTEARLESLPPAVPTVLVNHFPLRYDLVRLRLIPRFSPWCGTTRTEDWHRRYRARVVVSGHLHVRRTDHRDGTRFEEVSLGYPRDWDRGRGVAAYLRQILPEPE